MYILVRVRTVQVLIYEYEFPYIPYHSIANTEFYRKSVKRSRRIMKLTVLRCIRAQRDVHCVTFVDYSNDVNLQICK